MSIKHDVLNDVDLSCCASPAVNTMDYVKHSPANWSNGAPRVNRVCTKCWTHWFGPPSKVKRYTKAEWDSYVSEKK